MIFAKLKKNFKWQGAIIYFINPMISDRPRVVQKQLRGGKQHPESKKKKLQEKTRRVAPIEPLGKIRSIREMCHHF